MPRDASILGTRSGRAESPEIECLFQEAIGDAFSSLLEEKGIYQNVTLNLEIITAFLDKLGKGKAAELLNEFSSRPWIPLSPKVDKRSQNMGVLMTALAAQPLGTLERERHLVFPLPSITLYCKQCKRITTHESIGSIWRDRSIEQLPQICDFTREFFNLHYNCGLCGDFITVFLIKRTGLKIQLCGRSEKLHQPVSELVPKQLRAIVEDAINSVSENDVFAGFYHLRTFCEHYMKLDLEIAPGVRISGDELCDQYNSKHPVELTSRVPSLGTIYTESSQFMHTRTGDTPDFQRLLGSAIDHLQIKTLYKKYNAQSTAP